MQYCITVWWTLLYVWQSEFKGEGVKDCMQVGLKPSLHLILTHMHDGCDMDSALV